VVVDREPDGGIELRVVELVLPKGTLPMTASVLDRFKRTFAKSLARTW